jgi:glycosyltransferase involved in cell wall biosynthesis
VSGSRPGPIAFFLPSLRAGGAERVVVSLAQGIAERGLPLDVVLAAAEGAFLDQLPAAVRVVDLRAGRVLRSFGPLVGYLRRERPRVLVPTQSHANLVALWAAKLAGRGTPVVVTEHTTFSHATRAHPMRGRLWSPLLRTFYPWAASIVAVSRAAADDLAATTGVPRDRIEVIYNPVISSGTLAFARQAPDHPWLRPGQPPVVLGVGRLTAPKDFGTLIRGFAEVRRHCPARLIILGEGEERAALEAVVREVGLTDNEIALPGYRENPLAYMAASAVFVLSSAWEGLPTVLIEALAVGAKVVSTDCRSGPREILQGGRLGALVPVGDPAALAGAILDALQRPARPAPLEALMPFTRDVALDHYLRLIEKA